MMVQIKSYEEKIICALIQVQVIENKAEKCQHIDWTMIRSFMYKRKVDVQFVIPHKAIEHFVISVIQEKRAKSDLLDGENHE